jgi:hypothetical protein
LFFDKIFFMAWLHRLNKLLAATGCQLVPGPVQQAVPSFPLAMELQDLRAELQQARTDLLRNQIACHWSAIDTLARRLDQPQELRTCPICELQTPISDFKLFKSHCIFGGGDLIRYQCSGCGLIFGPDKMFELSPAALGQDYEWHYRAYTEGDSTESERRAFFALQPQPGGIYLNYGAGAWSRSVQLLRQEGWQVYAYEPHGSASPTGPNSGLLDFSQMQTMRFDGIFSNNVLEHFRYPIAELQKMATYLSPRGRMAHATPCYEYLYEYTRFHLFFFTGVSRDRLLQKAGLELIDEIVDGDFMCRTMQPHSR